MNRALADKIEETMQGLVGQPAGAQLSRYGPSHFLELLQASNHSGKAQIASVTGPSLAERTLCSLNNKSALRLALYSSAFTAHGSPGCSSEIF